NTQEEAEFIATSFYQFALGVIRGTRVLLQPPLKSMDNLWTSYEAAAVQQMMAYTFIGDPLSLERDLEAFLKKSQVDELMVVSHIYDHSTKIRSYEILAEIKRRG